MPLNIFSLACFVAISYSFALTKYSENLILVAEFALTEENSILLCILEVEGTLLRLSNLNKNLRSLVEVIV